MKKLIAIDILLIPSIEISEESIKLSESIVDSRNQILLNSKDCLPHISLAMFCTVEENISKINKIIQEIIQKYKPFKLKIIGLKTGETFSALEIEKTNELQKFHEEIIRKLSPFMNQKATKEAFVEPSTINELTLGWVDNFKTTSCFEKYWPHITLGYGEVKKTSTILVNFTSSTIGIYQLGLFCTCRKKLTSIDLK
ncbi:2'-5' RNA ligase family protein [Candidatus Pacearchaeota archaeon]|nr:2'-5' RNA ligase family protein [Candidatus Pacearchaeota archaeon]